MPTEMISPSREESASIVRWIESLSSFWIRTASWIAMSSVMPLRTRCASSTSSRSTPKMRSATKMRNSVSETRPTQIRPTGPKKGITRLRGGSLTRRPRAR